MIAIVLGTRPEIIKMYPVIKACEKLKLDHIVIHSGQHYSYEMDKIFFEELNIKKPDFTLEVGSGFHGEQTAKIIDGCEKIFLEKKPSVVLVEGDTNTVFGAAIAAAKLKIKVGHVEAGLRSFDRDMPEEINRILTDHVSDYCFAPTKVAEDNLLKEGIEKEKIFITGNTIVDALLHFKEVAEQKSNILKEYSLESKKYVLATAHRQENVDDEEKLRNIMKSLVELKKDFDVIYPIHPRTMKMMKKFKIEKPTGVIFTDPLGYLDFIKLQNNAALTLTDSGGLQEESCILGVPCVTLRENTERPETLEVGSNVLAGTDPEKILECTKKMLGKTGWKNPFGDGTTGEQIVKLVK